MSITFAKNTQRGRRIFATNAYGKSGCLGKIDNPCSNEDQNSHNLPASNRANRGHVRSSAWQAVRDRRNGGKWLQKKLRVESVEKRGQCRSVQSSRRPRSVASMRQAGAAASRGYGIPGRHGEAVPESTSPLKLPRTWAHRERAAIRSMPSGNDTQAIKGQKRKARSVRDVHCTSVWPPHCRLLTLTLATGPPISNIFESTNATADPRLTSECAPLALCRVSDAESSLYRSALRRDEISGLAR